MFQVHYHHLVRTFHEIQCCATWPTEGGSVTRETLMRCWQKLLSVSRLFVCDQTLSSSKHSSPLTIVLVINYTTVVVHGLSKPPVPSVVIPDSKWETVRANNRPVLSYVMRAIHPRSVVTRSLATDDLLLSTHNSAWSGMK